jgi:hypothetical protein
MGISGANGTMIDSGSLQEPNTSDSALQYIMNKCHMLYFDNVKTRYATIYTHQKMSQIMSTEEIPIGVTQAILSVYGTTFKIDAKGALMKYTAQGTLKVISDEF